MTQGYHRTKGEFLDAFNYGKVYFIRKVDAPDVAYISRVYYLKKERVLRTMRTVDRKKITGLDPELKDRLVKGNYIYIDSDNYISILVPEVNPTVSQKE